MSIYIPISHTGNPDNFKLEYTANQLPSLLRLQLETIRVPCDATAFMDLCRESRQPQLLWMVDYIEARPLMSEVADVIRQAEKILYGDTKSMKLLTGYTANIYQEIAFHTIRMHLRAEEGDIQGALGILNTMVGDWFDRIPVIRQSNLLVHACFVYMCCKEFAASFECYEQHWLLLKHSSASDRVELGIWDNHVLLQMGYWFFIKHNKDFADFYAIQTKVADPATIWMHKKIPLLNFLDYDHSWLVAFCSLPFYRHACSLMPSLPIYEKKPSTPVNHLYYLDEGQQQFQEATSELVGWEKYYFEQFNHENRSDHLNNVDLSDSALYSYLHFHTDYDKDKRDQAELLNFLEGNYHSSLYTSVLDAGCGPHPVSFPNKSYVGVDVAEHICNLLKEQHIDNVHMSAPLFLLNTQSHFDLCFANDLLAHLSEQRLEIFLENCAKKCDVLVAGIDLESDNRKNILVRSDNPTIELHLSLHSADEWIQKIKKHFRVMTQYVSGNRLLGLFQSVHFN